jgi:hypothetical protein
MHYLGVDVGKHGGLGVVSTSSTGSVSVEVFDFSKFTEPELTEVFSAYKTDSTALIEKVGAFPGQGVVSMFSFGDINGFIRGCLTALKVPLEFVSPRKWQSAFSCLNETKASKTEHKNVLKAKAQQLYPNIKVTLNIADALLIATYHYRRSTGQISS